MTQFFYLHGFNSGFNPQQEKIQSFGTLGTVHGRTTNYLISSEVQQLAFAIAALDREIDEELVLVGTSLGGYFARSFANFYDLRCIILNPSMNPFETLKPLVGQPLQNYLTGSTHTATLQEVEELAIYDVETTPDCLAILATDDEVIDYKIALELLKDSTYCVMTVGGHRLNDVNSLLETIQRFINTLPGHGSSIQDIPN